MSEKTKNIIIGVLVVGLVSMTVAYAALSQTLTINGTAKIADRASTWNVHFTAEDDANHSPTEFLGYASLTSSGTLNVQNTTVTAPDVTLRAPGDKVSFYFDVVNEGVVDAKLSSLPSNVDANGILTGYTVKYADGTTDAALTTFMSNNIVVKLTYADGTKLAANQVLYGTQSANTTKRKDLLLTIEFKNLESTQTLLAKAINITNITSTLTYVQN